MSPTKQLLRNLHPDTNGGDHSRVDELMALLQRLRNICQCGCKMPLGPRRKGYKYYDSLHYQLARRGQTAQRMIGVFVVITLAGCAVLKPRSQVATPPLPTMVQRRSIIVLDPTLPPAPPRMRGCAWEAPADFNPLTQSFEVWATTNLADVWTLKTNTTATIVLWPEQTMEFYMVRTRDIYGQVSDWATTSR